MNCFYNVLSFPLKSVRTWGDSDGLWQRAAAYTQTLLEKEVKHRLAPKKRRTITLYPPVDDQRKMLMLNLITMVSGFRRRENRDYTDDIKLKGTAIFWEHSSHFRRLRKQLGIKGRVCRDLMVEGRYPEAKALFSPFAKDSLRDHSPFFYWRRDVIDKLKEIETELSTLSTQTDYLRYVEQSNYRTGTWNYECVWEKMYRNEHFMSMAPILTRLRVYQWVKARRAHDRKLFQEWTSDVRAACNLTDNG